ncbi:MAG: lytic transglycosylase domain-containing protein [Thermotogaceae bacterium]|nr:lytic transglycosylase domain-containing protein [Thermotogaceae bacterium]
MKNLFLPLILSLIIFNSLIFADPLSEIEWMRDSKDFYIYIKAGSMLGVKAIKVFEVPIFWADPVIAFTGCDINLIKAMVRNESGFKVHAKSKTGALGVSQIVRSTAKWLGLRNPYNAFASSFAMCKYVRYLYKKFPDTEKMLIAYHDGEGNVSKGKISPEGKKYARIVLKYYREYQQTGKLEFFKDRVYFFTSFEYFYPSDFEIKVGGVVSLLGEADLEGGIYVNSEKYYTPFVRSYIRPYYDLAFILGWSNMGWEFGSSTWYGEYNLEVVATPQGPESTIYYNGMGLKFKRGRIALFYRFGW